MSGDFQLGSKKISKPPINICSIMAKSDLLLMFALTLLFTSVNAQQKATITIDANKLGARVSPDLHGIFFEEISHAGEGGIYAELIQNRGFEEIRLPQSTTLVDGFLVPGRTPHFSMKDNGISDWKMESPWKSDYPAWSLQSYPKSAAT